MKSSFGDFLGVVLNDVAYIGYNCELHEICNNIILLVTNNVLEYCVTAEKYTVILSELRDSE